MSMTASLTGDDRLPVTALSWFLGTGIDWPALNARLDSALLPEGTGYNPEAVPNLPDPFPQWRRVEQVS